MKTEALQTIELLSLEVNQGCHELQLAVESDGRRYVTTLEVDERTGLQLLPLGPGEGERARLSLYTSWDPYRQVHYSSVIKSNSVRSETHYFTCSKLYGDLMEQLRLGELPERTEERPAEQELQVELKVSKTSNLTYIMKITRLISVSLRLIVLTCVLYIGWFELEGGFLTNQGEAGKDLHVPVAATEVADEEQAASRLNDHIVQAQGEDGGEDAISASLKTEAQPPAASGEAGQKPAAAEAVEITVGKPYYSLPKGLVALTFDDGPSIYTKDIVDELLKHEVAATFLFVGKNAGKHAESVTYAYEQGMAVGNHSWDHGNLAALKNEKMATNIAGANEKLEQFIGQPITLFRPPYGSLNDRLTDTVEDMGMKMLMWNRDPEDWRTNAAKDILQYFQQTDPSGGIYVLHEKKTTLEALPDIIEYLKKQELKFVIFQ